MATSVENEIVRLVCSVNRKEYEKGIRKLFAYLQPGAMDMLATMYPQTDHDNVFQEAIIAMSGLIKDRRYQPLETAKMSTYFQKLLVAEAVRDKAGGRKRRIKENEGGLRIYTDSGEEDEAEGIIYRQEKLSGCIEKLNRQNIDILEAFYVHKRRLVEIHQEFGLQYNTVKQRISSIRKQLKKCIST